MIGILRRFARFFIRLGLVAFIVSGAFWAIHLVLPRRYVPPEA